MPLIDIQGEIDNILNQVGSSNPLDFKHFQTFLKDPLRSGLGQGIAAPAIKGLKTFGTLANSGTAQGMSSAYQIAQNNLKAAIADGDSEGAAYWSSALSALGAGMQDLMGDDGSGGSGGGGGGGGSPYDSAMALAKIYDTAVNLGTMKAGAADKALAAALDQAKLTQDRDYVPGWEPNGMISGMLATPWGGIGDAGRYTKVKVPDADTISKAAEDGFNQALAQLLGAMPGSGGGGGGGDYGGGGGAASSGYGGNGYGTTSGAVAAASASDPGINEGNLITPDIKQAVGDFGSSGIAGMVDQFLNSNTDAYLNGGNSPVSLPRLGARDPSSVNWDSDVPFWATGNDDTSGSTRSKKRPFWQRGLGY